MTIPAYPLSWPSGWKRTGSAARKDARFGKASRARAGGGWDYGRRLTINEAVTRLRDELERMGVSDNDLVINTDLKLRLDGLPRSDQHEPEDPGAVAYWRDKAGNTRCMAIDRYVRVADNLAAIAATIEAMRAIERHGGAEILDRAFTGFAALEHSGTHWNEVLGVPATASRADIDTAYRRLRSQHHPDKGGDADMFGRIQKAYEEATTA